MYRKMLKQDGFSAVIIIIVVLVLAVGGLSISKVISNSKQPVSREVGANQTAPLSAIDMALLTDAKELKKIDFDLDGVKNAQDADDDNDGTDDDEDKDDDNDGTDDDEDKDDDNDGTDDDEDTEADEAAEASELETPDQD